ncbi:MAG: TPM domain-containing protein, partial [Oscillospiraceae bacterium]|nr:TPM domain-containing protein [Oscillospiraceae bacterium]
MIKKLLSVMVTAFAALIVTAVPTSAWSAGINDMAGLYSSDDIAQLEARQEEVSELTGWTIAVVTTDVGFGLDGVDACDYAEQYCYDTFGDDPDSVVYLIDLDYRWISLDGDLYNYFNSSRF